jgi:hypothetical protein
MPFARCPVCQSLHHLLVRTSPQEWEREHVREREVDGTPLLRCFKCWVDLRPGHQVTLRTVPPEFENILSVGDHGIVEASAGSDGVTILVRFANVQVELKREFLSYVFGQP